MILIDKLTNADWEDFEKAYPRIARWLTKRNLEREFAELEFKKEDGKMDSKDWYRFAELEIFLHKD